MAEKTKQSSPRPKSWRFLRNLTTDALDYIDEVAGNLTGIGARFYQDNSFGDGFRVAEVYPTLVELNGGKAFTSPQVNVLRIIDLIKGSGCEVKEVQLNPGDDEDPPNIEFWSDQFMLRILLQPAEGDEVIADMEPGKLPVRRDGQPIRWR